MNPEHPADVALLSVRLCTLCMNRDDGQFYCGTIPEWGECSRCGCGTAPHVLYPAANDPRKAGWGVAPSTSVAVIVAQPFRWDVNGFYARLGVEVTASRVEIRDAYALLQHGADPLLTEAFKFLINADTRWEYDRRPLGRPVNDSRLYDAILRQTSQAEADFLATGAEIPDWIQRLMEAEAASDEPVVDGVTPERHDEPWPYCFYSWQSGNRQIAPLQEWQELLLRAVAEQKEVLRLAVGYAGNRSVRSWVVEVVDDLVVAFLCDTETPTVEHAEACAMEVIRVSNIKRECASV